MGSKNKAPFFMKIKFCLPSKSSGNTNAIHVKYIAADAEQAIESNIDSQTSNAVLFGINDVEDIKSIQKELRKHDGVVWRFILSLREDDARRMGHNRRDDWERIVRVGVINAAIAMGIDVGNQRWAAAFHNEPGHPHVHLMIWEKEPRILRGKLDDIELKNVRRAFMREFYRGERLRLMLERTELHDFMREIAIFQMGIRPRKNRGDETC